MIAVAVLAVSIAAALQAMYFANTISIDSKETTIALNDARAVLERVKVTPIASLPQNTSVDAETIWTDLAAYVSNTLTNEAIEVTGDNGASLRQITVSVQWTGTKQRVKLVEISTMKGPFNG